MLVGVLGKQASKGKRKGSLRILGRCHRLFRGIGWCSAVGLVFYGLRRRLHVAALPLGLEPEDFLEQLTVYL